MTTSSFPDPSLDASYEELIAELCNKINIAESTEIYGNEPEGQTVVQLQGLRIEEGQLIVRKDSQRSSRRQR
ncbi:hypothetical protein AOLI_G00246050 [Acnodon oligacanthus]